MERWERPSSSRLWNCAATPLPRLFTPATCFPSSCPSPSSSVSCCLILTFLNLLFVSFSLPDIVTFLSYLPRLLALHFLYFSPFSLIPLSLFPHPLPPSRPKEIRFPPLPGLFTMIRVCMADKDHIALSIWRHLSRILYTRSFTHLHTLNTTETTSILCVHVWLQYMCVYITSRFRTDRKLDWENEDWMIKRQWTKAATPGSDTCV